jgi:hypothetical protein
MAKSDDDRLTPEDMVGWLQQEIRDLSKATELRIKDATDFVTAYALGRITEEEMHNRRMAYLYRWGEDPIPGVVVQEGMTNEEVIKRLDAALPKTVRESVRRLLAKQEKPGHDR